MDIEKLRALVSYNFESGELKRKDRPRGRKTGAKPRHTIMVANVIYARTRLAWALSTSEWPKGRVYVVDGDQRNFALSNLSQLKPRKHSTADSRRCPTTTSPDKEGVV
jgi:hypothetical protein